MSYPFWDTGIGYGYLMAFIAVLHVFVSHFAIGGGFYLVVAEHAARKQNDTERLGFLERLSKFFVLVTLVFGALTGVGIWFIIGLLNPAATEVLIHNFVWGWATEWTFFVVEIASALIYYYGWKTMSARAHLTVGWIYFIAAWLSLFVINGIVTFMLTPGDWLATGNFWDGFFNPTFWPSLVFRTGISVMLAGLLAMAVAARYPTGALKGRLVRYNTLYGLIGLAVMVPSFYWYWEAIPERIMTAAAAGMPTPMAAIDSTYWLAGAIAVGLIVFGLLFSKRMHLAVAIVLMALGLGLFGGFEWFRESVRKPYVVYDYMYGNSLEVSQAETHAEQGLLASITYATDDPGADLFRRACRSCHTIDGYKPLAPAFDGTDREFIAQMIMGADALRGNMPPFMGTEDEAQLIAAHIYQQVDHRPISEIYGLNGVALGKKVYDIRCGQCHVMGGYGDKYASLVGLTAEDYESILDFAGEFDPAMPDFTGSDAERAALIEYLLTLGKEGGGDAVAGL